MISSGKGFLVMALAALLLGGAAFPQDKFKSDPEAVAFLKQAEARMYSPLREGLRTLSFYRSEEVEGMPASPCKVRLYFKAPDKRAFKIEFEKADIPAIPGVSPGDQAKFLENAAAAASAMQETKYLDTLGLYVGNFITHDLDQYRVRFLGDRKGPKRIRCDANPGSPLSKYINARDLIFDESGLLSAVKIINAQGNTQMVKVHLKELKGTDQYVFDRFEIEMHTIQGRQKVIQAFTYGEVKGYHLIMNTKMKVQGLDLEVKIPTHDVKVNEPIDDSVFAKEKKRREEKMNIDSIHWLGHDAFRIDGPPVVYFDPWNLKEGSPKADVICVTHDHFDHFSKPDIEKISGPDTVILTTRAVAAQLGAAARGLEPGDSSEAHGVKVEAVPAYNVNKQFHPRKSMHLGFIVEVKGMRIYHAGDTDFIPEMKEIRCDVALLPVSGTYVMTAEEAVKAAEVINPKIAIPMHYGEIVGDRKDADRFKELYKGECRILEKE